MKTIFKYPLELQRQQTVWMPDGAKILCVNAQGMAMFLWAEIEPTAEKFGVCIELFGTGHEIPEDMGISRSYIGTVFQGEFVRHIYERLT